MSKLLIDDRPLIILPKLATIIGLNEAIVLQQIHYWVETYKAVNDTHHFQDGEWWVWNTGEEWAENFPFWSQSTVWRALENLRNSYLRKEDDTMLARGPLVITGRFNKKGYDRTLWYRIDYEELDRLEAILSDCEVPSCQNDEMDLPRMTSPIPETTTESTTETLSADADVETPTALDTGPLEVDISPGSRTLQCPNPECEKEIRVGSMKVSATACPMCEVPLSILVDGEPYGKPPKPKKKQGDKRILGNLLEDCPPPLELFPYFARERKEILAAYNGRSKAIFLEALEWSRKAYLHDGLPHHLLVRSALGFFRKKVSAAGGTVQSDIPDEEGSWFVPEFYEAEGSTSATQETDDRRVGVLVR